MRSNNFRRRVRISETSPPKLTSSRQSIGTAQTSAPGSRGGGGGSRDGEGLKITSRGCGVFTGILLIVLLIGFGCQQQKRSRSRGSNLANAIDPIRLERDIHLQIDNYFAVSVGTANKIAAQTQDRSVREHCLRWKMRVYDIYQDVLNEEDPRRAFIHEWMSVVGFRQYLTTGAGKEIFGSGQGLAISVIEQMEADVVRLGKEHFSSEAIQAAKNDIEEAAVRYSPRFSGAQVVTASAQQEDDLGAILRIPLLPIETLQSVPDTSKAIGRFTDTAQDFSAVVKHLPEQTRWQMELLLLEMETSGPVNIVVSELVNFEEELSEVNKTIKMLPQNVRVEFEQSLEAIEKLHPQIKDTLAATRALVELTTQATEGVVLVAVETRATAEMATESARAFQEAAAEVRSVITDFEQLTQPSGREKETGEGVKDYHAAAKSVTEAAREIRATLAELRRPIDQQAGLVQAVGDIRGLIGLIFWRMLVLVVVIFLLGIGYRLVVSRLVAKR